MYAWENEIKERLKRIVTKTNASLKNLIFYPAQCFTRRSAPGEMYIVY